MVEEIREDVFKEGIKEEERIDELDVKVYEKLKELGVDRKSARRRYWEYMKMKDEYWREKQDGKVLDFLMKKEERFWRVCLEDLKTEVKKYLARLNVDKNVVVRFELVVNDKVGSWKKIRVRYFRKKG